MNAIILESMRNHRDSLLESIRQTENGDEKEAMLSKIYELQIMISNFKSEEVTGSVASNLRDALENCQAFDVAQLNDENSGIHSFSAYMNEANIVEPEYDEYQLEVIWGDAERDLHCWYFTAEDLSSAKNVEPGVWELTSVNDPDLVEPIKYNVRIRTFVMFKSNLKAA